jgi:tRNA nucleotidyltransferase (CCA-adding enzyme)
MQVYLVGGAVRDELLGCPVSERDWVVVGATPAAMERAGYRAVGRDFPVFLHPQTHEEYALARLERKVAPGYRGFQTHSSPEVTLEDDLRRRDLTINAMARASDGTLIDPYGGARDLQARWLRHVSPAFVEDPVRVLRAARFAARFAGLGFRIAPETMVLMQRMVAAGEIDALVPERVWREMERALAQTHPEAFFTTLADCGALAVVLPEVTALLNGPATSAAALAALQAAAAVSAEPAVRFAALIGGATPETIDALCEHLRIPNEYRELALLLARLEDRIARAAEMDGAQRVALLEAADSFRRPERFAQLLLACEARARAAGAHAGELPWPARALLRAAHAAAASASLSTAEMAGKKGHEIAAALRARRAQAIAIGSATAIGADPDTQNR